MTVPSPTEASQDVSTAVNTVLVVEDSETVRQVLTLILESEGFRVLPAGNGASAVALAVEMQPHAVTLDLALPDADGRVVLRELKTDERTGHIPVIVLSAFADKLSTDDRWYADDVITKPFDLDDLLGRLRRVIDERSSPAIPHPSLGGPS